MKSYDHVIIGSGISGLSLALILSLNKKTVLVIEKSSKFGGSLRSFNSKGGNFDIGFHFTGGLNKGELMYEMLKLVGLEKNISQKTKPLSVEYFLEGSGRSYDLPQGVDNIQKILTAEFKNDAKGINDYFKSFKETFTKTKLNNMHELFEQNIFDFSLPEDQVSLEDILNRHIKNPFLKNILASPSLCYGTSPKNISFANHVRTSYYFYKSLVTLEGGGETIFSNFFKKAKSLNVEFLNNSYPVDFKISKDNHIQSLILNSGQKILLKNIAFTIHPKEILKTLQGKHLKKSLINRINDFEASIGFFSVFCKTKNIDTLKNKMSIIFNKNDLNNDFLPPYNEYGCTCIIPGQETFCILESMHPDKLSAFNDSYKGKRPQKYYEYKNEKEKQVISKVENIMPEIKNEISEIISSTPLTYRDYLNNFDGSAYGIKQKIGQFNLFGRVNYRNAFVCGQSAFLPGILGSFFSSMLLSKQLLGNDIFYSFIRNNNK